MEKLSTYFLSLLAAVVILNSISCTRETSGFYKKTFTEEEKKKLSGQFVYGIRTWYYQGTTADQALALEGLDLHPENPVLWRELGAPSVKRGFGQKTHEYYGKAVELDPVEWQGWRGYLYLYFYRDYERALNDFITLDTLTPGFVDYPQATSIYFMQGICHLQLGHLDRAIEFFDRHIEEELKNVEEEYIDAKTFLYKGIANVKKGALQQAKVSFERGLKNVENKNADLWFWLAKTEGLLNNKNAFHQALEQAAYHYKRTYYNQRPYVEEFYQLYPEDFQELKDQFPQLAVKAG
jgi:tetratricopeptide (TPR) repeat protein